MPTDQQKHVAEYYRDVLTTKDDLKTKACCAAGKPPSYLGEVLSLIHREIQDRFYGCGNPLPLPLRGLKILDLGCGTGRDSFVHSYFAGESGEVVGIDMLPNQLSFARKYIEWHMKQFGFKCANVRFEEGFIENLPACGIKSDDIDVVISNCVVNLSPDKEAVLKGVYNVLISGGEFFFSDVYADRRLPEWAGRDRVLLGECLGGALYWKDFERLAKKAGFDDPRVFSIKPIQLSDPDIIRKIGFARFFSITYRLFKIPHLEDACEDYGQTACYRGSIAEYPESYKLDDHHVFPNGKIVPVCGNTAGMIAGSRLREHFILSGDRRTHLGLFAGCSNATTKTADGSGENMPGCC